MPAQVLVTGGTGFIGRSLVRALLRQGEAVRLLARDTAKSRELFGNRVEIAPGDLWREDSVAAACSGIRTIYHVGGLYRFGSRHERQLWQTNVKGTENLLQAAWTARAEKVVHVSSAGAWDRTPKPLARFCHYKQSKFAAENAALSWAKRGLPVSIASPTCPIGAEDETPTPTGRIIRDFLRRRFPCAARVALNFLGVDDLGRGLIAVAERGKPGTRYLLGQENLWLGDFLALLASETQSSAPRWNMPWAFILAAGVSSEILDRLNLRSSAGMSTQLCLETALQARCVQFFDLAPSHDALGWKAERPLVESVRDSIAWFQRQGEAAPQASSESSSKTSPETTSKAWQLVRPAPEHASSS